MGLDRRPEPHVVYLLREWEPYEYERVLGVYSTVEKAKAQRPEVEWKLDSETGEWYSVEDRSRHGIDIVPMEVDVR